MALIEEIVDEPTTPSQERLLDAEEIEAVAATLKRPTAKMQLESLAKKLRKEAAALKVVEAQSDNSTKETGAAKEATPPSKSAPVAEAPAPAPATAKAPTPSVTKNTPAKAPPPQPGMYATVDRFAFDAGSSSDKFVSLYIPLPAVGSIPKAQVTCEFTEDSFDLIVRDLNGKSYRVKKDNLEHDIVVDKSKFLVKADKVVVKLAKVKGEYGSYDYWTKLSDPKRKEKERRNKSNPAASITDMMKDMYESGDDQMRKVIGETMLKQHRGELGKDGGMGGLGGGLGDMASGLGGLGDMGGLGEDLDAFGDDDSDEDDTKPKQ